MIQMIHIIGDSKADVICQIANALSISDESAEQLMLCLEEFEPSPSVLSTTFGFPNFPQGTIGFMVTTRKYNVNISKIALSSLLFLLGLVPTFGAILAAPGLIKDVGDSISSLNETEKAMTVLLRELSQNGEKELTRKNVRKAFSKYCKENAIIKDEIALNDVLNSLNDKGIIKIKMDSIQVLT